jgi:segregation and condensation protein B
MDRTQQKQIVEALILAAPEPVTAGQLSAVVPGLTPASARQLVAELADEYGQGGRGFELWEVAGGFQLRTRPDLAPWVRQLQRERPLRLSRAALETLAVIAYKQPVTRAEIEHVRGVDAGPVLRTLVERKLVRIAGHREVPGRPMVYATHRRFLEVFGLGRLEDLPTLREIEDLLAEPGGAADEAEPAPAPPAAEPGGGVAGELQ